MKSQMIEKFKERFVSLNPSQKKFLGLELSLTLFSIFAFLFMAIGESKLELLILPVSATLLVPFFATFAYYKGFGRTGLFSILSIFLAPASGLIYLLLNTPSEVGSLFVVFMLIYSVIASSVIPYIVFAGSLMLHYHRSRS